jgi:hypothetical protein
MSVEIDSNPLQSNKEITKHLILNVNKIFCKEQCSENNHDIVFR